ncbi:PREDICTED: uncharacterized protein LOC108573973 [Habropoda laboriosa]|uniref:uncharacterized protein LOC108573973 n=1 Tax=Habropoda laboriosa TaxID=597456 RepID=UPI00083DFE32|nr:PREDICTED: uncharacterized protein LOC108573973 [Habropoda laboriosa]
MYRDPNSSSGSGTSTKGDDVEIVSRFLAPLCARDETARNIALAAARNTVEGWLGGVGSPNHWDDAGEMEDLENIGGKFKSQDGRYDMSIERSPIKSAPKNVLSPIQPPLLLQDTFRTEGFFPQSVTEIPAFLEDNSLECSERYPSGSFDCVDGRLGNETGYGTPNERRRYVGDVESYRSGHSTSSDEGKGFKIDAQDRCLRFKDNSETRFGSSCESERKYLGSSSNERLNEVSLEDRPRTKNYVKVKGAKQKQLEDDELDSDTRIYGKSPKFDENLGANFDRRNLNFRSKGDMPTRDRRCCDSVDDVSFDETEMMIRNRPSYRTEIEGVVFNTLDGFENENANEIYHRQDDIRAEDVKLKNFEIYTDETFDDGRQRCTRSEQPFDYLRKNDERKFSAGQIKRPLSQDEDVSSKSGRVLESPDVTPGDVGRMLNLGNALDGPRQAQANKYLSLVTLHLPVILRLSVNCPFQNVRIKCAEILEMVQDRGLPVPVPAFDGPSAFVPKSELTHYQQQSNKLRLRNFKLNVKLPLKKISSSFETTQITYKNDLLPP